MSVFDALKSNSDLRGQFMVDLDALLAARFNTASGNDVTVDHIINKPEYIHAAASEVYQVPLSVSFAISKRDMISHIGAQSDDSRVTAIGVHTDFAAKIREQLRHSKVNISRAVPLELTIQEIRSTFPSALGLQSNIAVSKADTVADTLQRTGFTAVIPPLTTLSTPIQLINKHHAGTARIQTLVKWGIDPTVEDLASGCIHLSRNEFSSYHLQDDLVLIPIMSELYAIAERIDAATSSSIILIGSGSETVFALVSESLFQAAMAAAAHNLDTEYVLLSILFSCIYLFILGILVFVRCDSNSKYLCHCIVNKKNGYISNKVL